MKDILIPTSGKAEIHLTYGCDLSCPSCNRMSVLKKPHTPDMTVEDVREFFRQARALNWTPSILIIGGEPTAHPAFDEVVRLSREFVGRGLVQVWSNGYSEQAREALVRVNRAYDASIPAETHKPEGSRKLSIDDIYCSPADFGAPTYRTCWNHSSEICGVSVDAAGYSPCAIGGAIDGFLGLGVRTKRLADLFDPATVAEMSRRLCEHCGQSKIGSPDIAEWRAWVEKQKKRLGSYMSPTWLEAAKGRK